MALFSQKKTTTKKEKKAVSTGGADVARDLSFVLRSPRITEKAMKMNERNIYSFEVARSASKFDVREAVKTFYGVTPVRINIVNKSPRQFKSRSKGRVMTQHGMKKAYVYLKKGDSISLI
ncbi:50S ribosomal protein L23 [Candidatus Nomurabacteria bacterium]|nr:50S ribosomal protein L23 [Candidatus Nomurabacteria bacterium]